jgi:hypothetical protein
MKEQLLKMLIASFIDSDFNKSAAFHYGSEILNFIRTEAWDSESTMREELNELSSVLCKVANQLK